MSDYTIVSIIILYLGLKCKFYATYDIVLFKILGKPLHYFRFFSKSYLSPYTQELKEFYNSSLCFVGIDGLSYYLQCLEQLGLYQTNFHRLGINYSILY